MVKDEEARVEDKLIEDVERDRKLNHKESNLDPSKVETFNRRADRKREKYSRDNYYGSTEGYESEKMSRQG